MVSLDRSMITRVPTGLKGGANTLFDSTSHEAAVIGRSMTTTVPFPPKSRQSVTSPEKADLICWLVRPAIPVEGWMTKATGSVAK